MRGTFERDELMDERVSPLEVGSGLDPDWVGIAGTRCYSIGLTNFSSSRVWSWAWLER